MAAAEAGAPRLGGFARTTAFRLTLLHLGLTLLGTLALSGVAWWATVGFAWRQTAQGVERDVGVLLASAALSGPRGLALSIEARVASDRSGQEYYLLAGPDGGRIAGNLAQAPRVAGWQELRLERPDGAEPLPLLALGTAVPGGGGAVLVVARDLSPVRALEDRLWGAAGWVGGGALLLGLLGGLLIARGVARRAAAMAAALAAVEGGDLARRLPVRAGPGAGDEFDRLADRINAALDRLQGTVAALRGVTDDIAHDLRTPLARLRQRLEGAAARAATVEDWRAEAEAAIAECDSILEVFAALLRIAQVEAGARREAFSEFDLSAVAEAVAEAYAPAAEDRGQAFTAEIAPGLRAFGDRALVGQALANLVQNAVRHGRAPGGRVAVALTPQGDGGAAFGVEDDGPGIPPAERERVFRRFVRLDPARSAGADGGGSGLGLALVRAVAELHGAQVSLEEPAGGGPGLRAVVRFAAPPCGRDGHAAPRAGMCFRAAVTPERTGPGLS